MNWAEKKAEGTAAYKEKRFDDAVKCFTEAIDSQELQSDIDGTPHHHFVSLAPGHGARPLTDHLVSPQSWPSSTRTVVPRTSN